MTIPEAIEKAIEGGWEPIIIGGREEKPIVHISICGDMGSSLVELWTHYKDGGGNLTRRQLESIILDPLFWQALGKVMGWPKSDDAYETHRIGLHSDDSPYPGEPECDCNRPKTYLYYMHRMIDHLAEGGTLKSFVATL